MKTKKNGMTARFERRDAKISRSWIERIFAEVTYVGVAYIFGQAIMLFDTSPLGLALLCGGRGHVFSILTGLLLSAILHPTLAIPYIIMYAVAALVRILSRLLLDIPDGKERLHASIRRKIAEASGEDSMTDDLSASNPFVQDGFFKKLKKELSVMFSENVRLRMATAAICSLIVSLYRVFANGFSYYDWFSMAFCAVITPAAVMVYSVYLDGQKEHRWMYMLSAAMLLFSLIWASNEILLTNFSLPLMLALFMTLYASAVYGTAMGCFAGLLCGLAIDFLYAPAFLISSLIFSMIHSKKHATAGIFPSVLCAMIWLLYISGINQVGVFLPSLLLSGAIFTPVCAYIEKKENDREEEEKSEALSDAMLGRFAGERRESSSAHLRGISEAFSALSEMFYNLSDRFRRPGTLDLRCICDRAFDAHCADCPNKTVCWGLEYADTLDTVNHLISRLHTRGCVDKEQISEHLCHRCNSIEAILESINSDCARLTGELLRNNRTEIFAMDYEAAAKIINDALEEDNGEYCFDPELEEKVMEYLRDAGVRASGVTVYGQRRRQILVRGVDVEHATVTTETMRADLSEMIGMHLGTPTFEVEGGVSTMLFQARKKIVVIGAENNVSADGGVSGDTVNLFSNKKDYFYALINDGMGSGKEAALTSNLCSVFLEKMLRAGNRAGTSLKMLNNMIRSRCADSTGECSSTVDLLELDLMTSEASFIKSGAAPSFVVRGDTVQRLQSGSAPIGILGNLDAQVKHYTVRPGDLLVLVSDGIEQEDPDSKWLLSYLASCGDATPEEIVYQICLYASRQEHHDDCSAIALRILSAEEEET